MTGGQPVSDAGGAKGFKADQHCIICGELATHSVTEIYGLSNELIIEYLCCEHFSWIFRNCAEFPCRFPFQRSEER